MSTLVILFAVGLLLLSLEIFLPGGILGVMGGLTLVGAVFLAFRDYGLFGGAVALLGAVALSGGTLYVELVILPKTRLGRGLVLASEVTGKATIAADAALVGRSCEAVTALAPSGIVRIDGRRMEAFSRDGFIEAGETLVVHGIDNFRLIVSKVTS